jgi:hypothetical protein
MEITKENYFARVGELGVDNLPPAMSKMHELITKITANGKDWSKYVQFKSGWDKQFFAIGKLFEQKDKRPDAYRKEEARSPQKVHTDKTTPAKSIPAKTHKKYTEEDARRIAIRLIEAYVKRGDSYESIRSGQMGAHNGEFSAMIKGRKIHVDRIRDKRVNYSFTLQSIFNEIKSGMETATPRKVQVGPRKNFKKEKYPGKGVELVSPEVTFIKRFALLNGKEKNRQQVLNFIKAIQKAIVERKIRKASKYRKVIEYIQSQLVKTYNSMGESIGFRFTDKDFMKYLKIAGAEYLLPSVRFIKSYIGMLGNNLTKQRAANLLEKISAAFEKKVISQSDKYMKQLSVVIGSLERFLKSGNSPNLTEAQLSGLQGVLEACGCHIRAAEYRETYGSALEGVEVADPGKTPHNTILNSRDVINLKTEKLGFQGKWRDFIGNPSKGFTMMIYGKPKYGKTYLAVDFAGYLSRNHGRVLYVAREEGFDDTLQDKLRDKGVAHEDLDVADHLPKNLSGYDFVFFDSINRLDLSPEDVERHENKHPSISFIYVFQTNKGGDFKGSMEFKHNVDCVVEVPEKGLAVQYGRYNQGGEMRIF